MNPEDMDLHLRCLERAHRITSELKQAGMHVAKMAEILGNELRPNLSGRRLKTVETPFAPSKAGLEPGSISQGIRFVTWEESGLRGVHSIEDLMTLLLTAEINPSPSHKTRMKDVTNINGIPTFPFCLGFFASLALRNDLDRDLLRICEAGREHALRLSSAAVCLADGEVIAQIARGIATAKKPMAERHDIFSRHVAALRQAYLELTKDEKAQPVKAAVTSKAIELLKRQNIQPVDKTYHARWREYLLAADLSHLKQKRGGKK